MASLQSKYFIMEMKEIYSCDHYKVLNVILNAGEKMPWHEATSNAFLICKKGKGRITFSDRVVDVCANDTLLLKANEQHQVEIFEDFCSNIILDFNGKINFVKEKSQPFSMSIY
jgi:quercetin dioxygenase-like cupin family protein